MVSCDIQKLHVDARPYILILLNLTNNLIISISDVYNIMAFMNNKFVHNANTFAPEELSWLKK